MSGLPALPQPNPHQGTKSNSGYNSSQMNTLQSGEDSKLMIRKASPEAINLMLQNATMQKQKAGAKNWRPSGQRDDSKKRGNESVERRKLFY